MFAAKTDIPCMLMFMFMYIPHILYERGAQPRSALAKENFNILDVEQEQTKLRQHIF